MNGSRLWWVVTHFQGKRRKKRVGSSKADKRKAEKIINARLALGQFRPDAPVEKPLPIEAALNHWHMSYSATWKPAYIKSTLTIIDYHLIPYFGGMDLRQITEDDLLAFISDRLAAGKAPNTIRNALAALRRVLHLAERRGEVLRNPAARVGELMRQVSSSTALEVPEVSHWTHEEAENLLAVATKHDESVADVLAFALATGCRRGEILAVQWRDIVLHEGRVTIRRSFSDGRLSTPKGKRSRRVPLPVSAINRLTALLARRRRECLARGWREVPEFVFCTPKGTPWDPRNFSRRWDAVRRKAAARGVRHLKFHATRHTWATLALAAGKSPRWVADVLGHADPSLTLRVYAHALRAEETDLSFADFGAGTEPASPLEPVGDAPKRPYTAPARKRAIGQTRQPRVCFPRQG